MQYLKIAVLLFLLLISLSACSKSPEAARKELGQMNIDYTDDSFIKYVERGDKVVVELFLTAGKGPNLREKTSEDPILSIAAFEGRDEIVKLLIAKGADVNAKNKNGWTPLMSAIGKRENLETVKILLNKGADINAVTENGTSVLFIASVLRDVDTVELLLNKGALVGTISMDDIKKIKNKNKEIFERRLKPLLCENKEWFEGDATCDNIDKFDLNLESKAYLFLQLSGGLKRAKTAFKEDGKQRAVNVKLTPK